MHPTTTSQFLRVDGAPTVRDSRGQPVGAEPDDRNVVALHSRLQQLSNNSSGPGDVVTGAMALQNERDNVLGCLLLRRTKTGKLQIASQAMSGNAVDLPSLVVKLFPRAAASLQHGRPDYVPNAQPGCDCLVTPLGLADICGMVTCLQAPVSEGQKTIEITASQLIATYLEAVANRERVNELNSQLGISAATLELLMRVQNVATVDEASVQIVSALKRHLKCDQVFMGLLGNQGTCQIKAASDVSIIDPNAESTLAMKAVVDECVSRDECGAWPPLPGVQLHQLLAHKRMAGRDSLVISTPLKSVEGKVVGAIAVVGRREMATIPGVRNFVASFGEPVGSTIETVRSHQRSRVRRALNKAVAPDQRAKQFLAIILLLVVFVILVMPWPYTITCHSVIEPVERRFCVAPHDGMLEMTSAEPGDIVERGDLLARMDGREILWKLAGVSADKSRAAKKRDLHLAKQETSSALMADLELQRIENEEALLQFQESNLEMTAPIDGIVLSGSLDRRENYPVSKGQVLYEVAPLEKLRLEVNVPADEVIHVNEGNDVRVIFDGFGTDTVEGEIVKVHPRAEVRDDENVFVAEVLIDNRDGSLKPGMEGIAKIKTPRRSIAWIAFHHAIEKARAVMPW